jgi:hypothetical protein
MLLLNPLPMKTVVVLALPRSGSSLLAGLLHRLGVRMGREQGLLKGKHFNKYGSYENQDLLMLNFNILIRAGWTGSWAYIPDDTKIKDITHRFAHRIKKVIKRNANELWGWKDPFVAYSIPYLHKYLDNPHYIYLKRDINSVVNSQVRVSSFKTAYPITKQIMPFLGPIMIIRLILRWIKFFARRGYVITDKSYIRKIVVEGYQRIDYFVRGKKHITVQFEDLIDHPKKIIDGISRFLDIMPRRVQQIDAMRFVRPELVHF